MHSGLTLTEIAAIVGAEVHGHSSAVITSVSKDSRSLNQGELYVVLVGENFDGHQFLTAAEQAGAAAALVEKVDLNCRLPQLLVPNSLLALGQLAGELRARYDAPVVAITGSAGKTSTKQLIHSVLSQQFNTLMTQGNLNNHIGAPLTLLALKPEHQAAVIELGASGLGEIAYTAQWVKPNVGVITNAAEAHIEGFGSLAGVVKTKGELLDYIAPHGVAILNRDDPHFTVWQTRAGQDCTRKVISFGTAEDADVRATDIHCTLSNSHFNLHYQGRQYPVQLPMLGEHNVLNALAAAAVGFALQLEAKKIITGLETVAGVNGRLQQIQGRHGQLILNDTYNANPASMRAAINVLKHATSSWLVVGDMAELGPQAELEHQAIGHYAKAQGVQHLLATGELSKKTTEAFGAGARWFASKVELAYFLQHNTHANDVILVKGSRSAGMDDIVAELQNTIKEH